MKRAPLGRLSPRIDPEVVMMLCTAGHVDHGKTRLVGLLTGCQTDRLRVERERGLTIELGFAPCFLGGNRCVGIVDVPGHEKFIKNMVAGVSGIGLALLVIAADDGIMPQTVEHLQILELLGVRRGLVALTKIDLVEPDVVSRRIGEIEAFLGGTFLDGAPICPVSAETFEGYPEFYTTLIERIGELTDGPRCGVFRMPIERVFGREGFGAVVTGIPTDGTVREGDQLELVPGGQSGRVRAIQRFLRDAKEGGRGQCLALNIPDLSKSLPVRGQVLCEPGVLQPAKIFHLDVQAVPGLEHPLRNGEAVKFHTGTTEQSGLIYLLEGATLERGSAGLATVVLGAAVAAASRDRFIVRRPSPQETVAGGTILTATLDEKRPRRSHLLPRLRARVEAFKGVDPESREGAQCEVAFALGWDWPFGVSAPDLARATLLRLDIVREALAECVQKNEALALAGDLFIGVEAYGGLKNAVAERIRLAVERQELSLSTSALRGERKWPSALWNCVLRETIEQGLVRRRGDVFVVRGAVANLEAEDRALLERIVEIYRQSGFQSPRPAELPERLGASEAKITKLLRHLQNEAELIRVDKNVVLHYDSFKTGQELVVRTIQEKGSVEAADFRDRIQSSRKYVIAFLDFLDARGITIRVGNARKLAGDYESRLL